MIKITIQKRTVPEWLTCLLFLFPFVLPFLLQFLKLPGFMKYLMDLAWCCVLAITLLQPRLRVKRQLLPFLKLTGFFVLYTLVVYLLNYQSAVYYLWGFRNTFRYYVAFLAFAIYLRQRDAGSFLKLMDTLFWINAAVTFVQFFLLGLRQDYLGGIFGVERGCNGNSMIFFAIVLSKSILSYMNGREKALPCFLKCALSLVIAAMAELKMYFLMFVLILALAALFTRFSLRKFWVLFASSILVIIGSTLLAALFGPNNQLTLERIIALITAPNYATTTDLGRFTAIPTIARTILTELPEQLFGLGLGNCETSSFAICNTPFYQAHAHLHYTWFSSAFLFLETGFIGLGTHLAFFGLCFLCARRQLRAGKSEPLHCQIAMIMALLCVVLTFYNSSLRSEVGYLAYFALALPLLRE